MAAILSDGRITIDVEVVASPNVMLTLLADTGAELSALPMAALPASVTSRPSHSLVVFYVGGSRLSTVQLRGTTAEASTEPHGRGPGKTTSHSDIRVFSIPPGSTSPFTGFDGLLGMDMLDSFDADPVKNSGSASVAYLAQRV